MTQDVQHDRSASPLASVSDAIHPPTLSRIPEPAAEAAETPAETETLVETETPAETETPPTFDSDSFEGFGSFG